MDDVIDAEMTMARALSNFELDSVALGRGGIITPPSREHVHVKYRAALDECGALRAAISVYHQHGMAIYTLDRIVNTIHHAYEACIAAEAVRSSMCTRYDMMRHEFLQPMAGEKKTPLQQVLEVLWKKLYRYRYKCLYDKCMEQVVSPAGFPTHAWRPAMTIKDFIYKETQRHRDMDAFTKFMKMNQVDKLCDILRNSDDAMFPKLERNRDLFSFQNGVYNVRTNEFTPYEEYKAQAESINYLDYEFDATWCTMPFETIPIPLFESIFTFQGLVQEDILCALALLGRNYFAAGDRDDWQLGLFFWGLEQTGKSKAVM